MGRPKLTQDEIIKQVELLGLKFVKFIKYDGKLSIFTVKCEHDHEEYETTLSILNHGRHAKGCPTCKYLNKIQTNINKVGFENVKTYCENVGFDLPEFNVCIEYDGIQHFEAQEHFGGEQKYTELCIKDDIKNEFCFTNDIGMIRISYEDYDLIEYILEKELNLNCLYIRINFNDYVS